MLPHLTPFLVVPCFHTSLLFSWYHAPTSDYSHFSTRLPHLIPFVIVPCFHNSFFPFKGHASSTQSPPQLNLLNSMSSSTQSPPYSPLHASTAHCLPCSTMLPRLQLLLRCWCPLCQWPQSAPGAVPEAGPSHWHPACHSNSQRAYQKTHQVIPTSYQRTCPVIPVSYQSTPAENSLHHLDPS
jgi:hypothetical protein